MPTIDLAQDSLRTLNKTLQKAARDVARRNPTKPIGPSKTRRVPTLLRWAWMARLKSQWLARRATTVPV